MKVSVFCAKYSTFFPIKQSSSTLTIGHNEARSTIHGSWWLRLQFAFSSLEQVHSYSRRACGCDQIAQKVPSQKIIKFDENV